MQEREERHQLLADILKTLTADELAEVIRYIIALQNKQDD
jgi:hypothetical protein